MARYDVYLNQKDVFSSISDEVVVAIFLYLSYEERLNVRRTCKRFYLIGADPSLWKTIHWGNVTPYSLKKLDAMLKVAGLSLQTLYLGGTLLPSKYWKHVLRCHNLKIVEVFGWPLTIYQLKDIVRRAPGLTTLGFDVGDFGNVLSRSGESLQGYSPQQLSIVDLDGEEIDYNTALFMGMMEIDRPLLELLSPPCPYLSAVFRIYLRSTIQMDLIPHPPIFECQFGLGEKFPSIFVTDFLSLSTGLTLASTSSQRLAARLIGLMSGQSIIHLRYKNIIVKPFELIAQSIMHLDLRDIGDLSSAQLNLVGEMCSCLQQLVLDRCTTCLNTLEGLRNIAMKCPLQCLGLRGIGRCYVPCIIQLWDIIASMQKLTHLVIEGCLLQFPPFVDGLMGSNLGHLTALEVENEKYCETCDALDDKQLEIISSLVALTYLRVENLPPLNYSRSLLKIFTSCQGLKYVYMSTDGGQLILPTDPAAYPCLEQLYISSPTQQLGIECTTSLLSAKGLTHLYLVVGSMAENAVLTLARELRLVSCHINVTQPVQNQKRLKTAINSLLNGKPHLVEFIFKFCPSSYERTYFISILSTRLLPLIKYGNR